MAAGTMSDFTELVKLQSKDGKKHVLVHKDIITRSSLRMRRKLASRHVLGANGEKARPIAIDWTDLDAFEPYISWCYTASLRDDIARDFSDNRFGAPFQYLCGMWLLDAQYTNAIMDRLIEQNLGVETLMDDCRNRLICHLKGTKIWQWYVDQLAARITSDGLIRHFGNFSQKRNEIGLSRTVLEELLVRFTKRVEDPGAYGAMDGADSQKYYMSDESIERVLEAWSRDEDLSNS